MDETGRTARDSADQLGPAKISITQDRYQGRPVADTGAAAILGQLKLRADGVGFRVGEDLSAADSSYSTNERL